MVNLDHRLIAWLPPAASAENGRVMLGVERFATAPAEAVEIWRRFPRALQDADVLFCMGTSYALGAGVPEDWKAAHSLLLKGALRGHAGAAFNCSLLGLRRPIDAHGQRHFERAAFETWALLRVARERTKDAALLERIAGIEAHMRRIAPHALTAAEKLAASMIKEARIYAPAV